MLWAAPSSKVIEKNEQEKSALSIIICAQNEAANLAINLPLVAVQKHPDFEIIVVNDDSTDDTQEILQELCKKHEQLKTVTIAHEENRNLPGKKYALSKGIAAAKNEHLLLCDADCAPASEYWAIEMSNSIKGNKEIVAGYGAYKTRKGFLNTFIRWETMHTFLQYSCYAHSGIPYMAVGRNLACKKSLLEEAQSSPIWSSMPSGDDDLLIRLKGNKKNVAIVADPKAFTYSEAKSNFKEWIAQKQRHLSTGKLYRKSIQLLLGIYAASHGLMWLLAIILWISGMGYLINSLLILRCMLVWSLWAITAESLKEKKIVFLLPICDIAWAFYNLFLSPYIFYKTKKQWK